MPARRKTKGQRISMTRHQGTYLYIVCTIHGDVIVQLAYADAKQSDVTLVSRMLGMQMTIIARSAKNLSDSGQ